VHFRLGHALPLGRGGVAEPLGHGLGLGPAQGRGLRLAAALGDGLGEVREQHREPEPEIDLQREAQARLADNEVAHEQDRGQGGHDLDREHYGFAHHDPRIELSERVDNRRADDLRIGQRRDRHLLTDMRREFYGHLSASTQNRVPVLITKCSASGPSASAGK
jgi:hypothetical protein